MILRSNSPHRRSNPIRPRTVFLIMALVPLNCWWVVLSVLRRNASPTQISLFFNAISTILVLLILNAILSKAKNQIGKYMVLNRVELLTIYTCISIGSGIAGVDRIFVLTPLIGHAHWFATPENDWLGLFHRYIPDWLTVSDKRVMEGYYQGFSSIYHPINFSVWAPIVLWWCAFILALHIVMLCISVILRKQWVESERLSYPIIQLPLEMTYSKGRFFRSPWMWVGLMVGASIDIVNGLNFLFPSVPSLGGKLYDLRRIFTDPPWNAIGWSPMAIFPFGVGLSFFIPLDLSFSCWAFWLIWRLERLIGSVMGWRALARFPYEAEQSHGAYLGLCIFALWMSRKHLRYAVNCLFRPPKDNQANTVSYRTAFLGIIIGLTFMMFFCLKIGMSPWVIILFFAIWLAISIAITRLRAELGSPVHDLHFIGPDEILPRMFGVRRVGAANLTGFAYLYFLNRAHRSHVMPHQLEGFKLANVANIPLARFFWLMIFASGLGAFSSFWAFVAISYSEGGTPVFAPESFGRLERWLSFVTPPEIPAMVFVGIGFWITILLSAMRMNFLWWNLHPVGYAISGSWAINPMIGSIFVGWFLKWIILKYGGRKWHRGSIPFFLGIVLGEFIIGTFWSLLGIILAQPMYRFLF